jgi:hypothetical protein
VRVRKLSGHLLGHRLVEDGQGQGHVLVGGADDQRHSQHVRVLTRDHRDRVGRAVLDGLADLVLIRLLEAFDAGVIGLERRRHLVVEIAVPDQHDRLRASLRPATHPRDVTASAAMELVGLEPTTSWVRCGAALRDESPRIWL